MSDVAVAFTRELFDSNKRNKNFRMARYGFAEGCSGMALVSDNGDLIGYVQVLDGVIRAIEVADAYRRRGYGKRLLNYAVKNLGAETVTVKCDNKPAFLFFRKNKWNVADEMDDKYVMSR